MKLRRIFAALALATAATLGGVVTAGTAHADEATVTEPTVPAPDDTGWDSEPTDDTGWDTPPAGVDLFDTGRD